MNAQSAPIQIKNRSFLEQKALNECLIEALESKTNKVVAHLLAQGADPNARRARADNNGEDTALDIALYSIPWVSCWVELNSMKTMTTEHEPHPEERIKLLCEAGACIDTINHEGCTVFMKSFMLQNKEKREEVCQMLIDSQLSINNEILGLLYALKALKKSKSEIGTLLYNHRKYLVRPYLKRRYVSLKKLLSQRSEVCFEGRTAYEASGRSPNTRSEYLNPENYI